MKEFIYKHAVVSRVVDGDTYDIIVDLGFNIAHKIRVRLLGVDTPEVYGIKHDDPEYKRGVAASDFVKQRLRDGTPVTLRTVKDKKGKYGRYLAEVFYRSDDGTELSIGDEIIKNYHTK